MAGFHFVPLGFGLSICSTWLWFVNLFQIGFGKKLCETFYIKPSALISYIVAGFMRPVVIYGGVSDIAQERLLREVNDLFEAPPSSLDAQDEEISKSGIVKVRMSCSINLSLVC